MSGWANLEIRVNHDNSPESREFLDRLFDTLTEIAYEFTEDTPFEGRLHIGGVIDGPTPEGFEDEVPVSEKDASTDPEVRAALDRGRP